MAELKILRDREGKTDVNSAASFGYGGRVLLVEQVAAPSELGAALDQAGVALDHLGRSSRHRALPQDVADE